jgi:beta-1,4-mannosyltransferase
MKIFFMPFYKQNSFQLELANALRAHGVETIFINHIRVSLFPILRAVLQNGKPDIIHLHWTGVFLAGRNRIIRLLRSILFLFELFTLKILGIKLVWTVHNLIDHEKTDPVIEKYVNRICCTGLYNKIIVLSFYSVEAVMQAYQLPNRLLSKISIVPHGHYINSYRNTISKDQARAKLGIDNEDVVFLYLGQIKPYKGVFQLVEEFKKISNPRVFLLVAGKPKPELLKNELENACRGNKKIRTCLEFIPDDEIQLYMNAADIVALPFQDILNSGSVVLAMSFGKAVICPNIGSIPEILDDRGGFLYKPDDETGLVNAMNSALKSDLTSMGEHNFKKIKSFDWGMIAEKTYIVYKSCKK